MSGKSKVSFKVIRFRIKLRESFSLNSYVMLSAIVLPKKVKTI